MNTDNQTQELEGMPPLPKKRGRPTTGTAQSNAERQAAFRAKREMEWEAEKAEAFRQGYEAAKKRLKEDPDGYWAD